MMYTQHRYVRFCRLAHYAQFTEIVNTNAGSGARVVPVPGVLWLPDSAPLLECDIVGL